MPQTQPVLFDLEKFFVEREHLRWAPRTRRRKAAFRVRQNFLELSRCFHHAFPLEKNLESEIQKQNARTLRFSVRYPQSISGWYRTRFRCGQRTLQTSSVFQERSDRCRLELFTAAEEFQFNQELRFEQIAAGFSDQHRRGG
jgi:hypothetical protein